MTGTHPLLLLCPLLLLLGGGVLAGRQDPALPATPSAEGTPAQQVTRGDLATLREEIERDARQAAPRLDEVGRRQALDVLERAERDLRAAAAALDRTAELERLAREAPARLASLREELSRPPPAGIEVPPQAGPRQIEELRTQAEAERAARRQALDELALEATRRLEARARIPAELVRAHQELEALLESIAAARVEPPGLLERVLRGRLAAERERLEARVEELTAELASYQARDELLPARRELAQRRLAEAEQWVAQWRRLEVEARRAEAERASDQARSLRGQATAELAALRAYAIENERLARLRAEGDPAPSTLEQIETAQIELEAARRALEQRSVRYANLRRKLEEVGLIPSMARLLSEEYEKLADLRRLEAGLRGRRARLSDAQLQAILFEEQLEELGTVQDEAALLLEGAPAPATAEERAARAEAASRLVEARHELVARLAQDFGALYQALAELEATTRALVALTAEYRAYIEENILWVRSVKDVLPRPGAVLDAVAYVLDPQAWHAAIRASSSAWPRWGVQAAGLLLLLIGLQGLRRRMLGALERSGGLAARYSTDSYWLTLRALTLTLAIAASTPLTMWTIGWLLSFPHEQPAVALGVGAGLRRAAVLLLPLHVFAQVVRQGGLAQAHFRWPERSVASLRRHTRWLLFAMYPVITLVWTLRMGEADHHNSLGRIAFVVGAFLAAAFVRRVLRPRGSVLGTYYEENADGWPARMRVLWHVLGVGAPLVLALAAAAGYYYTALRLGGLLAWTAGLLLLAILVHALLLRWLLVERRRLAVEQARRRRAEALAAREAEEPAPEAPALVPEAELDLPAISAQTRQLFRMLLGLGLVLGLYMVWGNVLPALRVLDRVQIWPRFEVLEPETTRARAGEPYVLPRETSSATASTTPLLPRGFSRAELAREPADPPEARSRDAGVTLADLGLALLVLLVTLLAARNVPGLMEFTLFKRLHMDAGTRYATQTIARYVILIIGVSWTFGAIGIGWTEVQWLAAALTFGLAFGLQEIFANFVSGLIILFEQPIRVGDTVTVGGIDGRVSRISMRATTVTDFNRKELLIPNKEFITSQFVNWTLSDSVTRVIVPVGVAYGSDTRKVRELLEGAAKSVPYVLDKPPPTVVFRAFGGSSLDFELRIFIEGMDRWGEIINGIHVAIDDAFRAAGVEIAFPQLDLHLRTAAVPVRVASDEPQADPS